MRCNKSLILCSLDDDILVLRGAEDEAASQILKGTVVLCLPAALKVEDVHLRITGQLRVGSVLVLTENKFHC